jgi:hypothetical protein
MHYDAQGRMARMLQNFDPQGQPHTWMIYRDGVLSRGAFDTNNDGRPDQWHHYHSEGHLVRTEYDQNGDGRPDQWEHFRRGSQAPYKVERDTTGDGKADAVQDTSRKAKR